MMIFVIKIAFLITIPALYAIGVNRLKNTTGATSGIAKERSQSMSRNLRFNATTYVTGRTQTSAIWEKSTNSERLLAHDDNFIEKTRHKTQNLPGDTLRKENRPNPALHEVIQFDSYRKHGT